MDIAVPKGLRRKRSSVHRVPRKTASLRVYQGLGDPPLPARAQPHATTAPPRTTGNHGSKHAQERKSKAKGGSRCLLLDRCPAYTEADQASAGPQPLSALRTMTSRPPATTGLPRPPGELPPQPQPMIGVARAGRAVLLLVELARPSRHCCGTQS